MHYRRSLLLALATLLCLLPAPLTAQSRRTIPLDGIWQAAEGTMDSRPAAFDRRVPVPGLLDMAQPPFTEVGTAKSPEHRSAFWYRRTFRVDSPIPATVVLHLRKACFGTAVWLNGAPVGGHLPCFTPAFFDVKAALRGGDALNEVVVRVGADRGALPPGMPNGRDFEKVKYIPGIYDSVDLILTGAPRVENIQTAPDVERRAVRVQAHVVDAGNRRSALLRVTVREARSGKPVGESSTTARILNGEAAADLRVPIAGCRLWSPEDPFLYRVTVATDGDAMSARFGMRTFRFDTRTGRAILNGKPYFMRGSNICIFRFMEDSQRGDRPWRAEWVRRLHKRFKGMQWNCLRYCIGFPPEIWYDVADEEGLLIQDEFPVWGLNESPRDPSAEHLTNEYTEWMRERWNHPCVVIWDAQNETFSTETGKAIHAVRALDLSKRPWDNGWSPPDAPGDTSEQHAYHYSNPFFTPDGLAAETGTLGWKPGAAPIVVNEYGWLWLTRDGNPCTLTRDLYHNLLGDNSTTQQRRTLYARLLAADTEFFRAHRACAAVMHFCSLGYSRPDGQTSDNWVDVEKLTWEPEFYRYVRDAFAPVGVMVDVWDSERTAGSTFAAPVFVTNDLPKPWAGTIRLRLMEGARTLQETVRPCRVAALGSAKLPFRLRAPDRPGSYRIEAELSEFPSRPVRSLRDFAVLTDAERHARYGIAVGRPVRASSNLVQAGATGPEAVNDGRLSTRWSSEFSDPQWIAIDLGTEQRIDRVTLNWESAFARGYTIDVSTDGSEWRTVYSTEAGKGGREEIRFAPVAARWVRMNGTKRGTLFGYSLYEFAVFAAANGTVP